MDAIDRNMAYEALGIGKWVCLIGAALCGYWWVLYHALAAVHAATASTSTAALVGIALVGLTGLVFRYIQRRLET